jgi:hypothetical protein
LLKDRNVISKYNQRSTGGSKMSEKKMVRRSVAVALGIICIILVAGLGVVLYMGYSPTATNSVSSLQDKINQLQSWLDGNKTLLSQTQTWLEGNITNYNSQISGLQSDIASLNSTYNNYVSDHSYTNGQYQNLQSQITNLQSQIADLAAPNLVTVDLKTRDLGAGLPWIGTPVLHVYGYVCNVGAYAAYNSKIHVVAHQSGGVEAINTYIALGTLYGQSWTTVDSSFTYSGEPLLDWTITPQWTAAP